ncbi:TetR/AcrR family transcriptional regulator [Bdellovibrio sp. HCB337]|uniref:TetR/AcrR family transcriptional regulator n=1 Tax=Bdellovibrio sp. HCB337 TaxID=3394358 RepID=UPI0039A70B1F
MPKTRTRNPEKTRAHILNAAFLEIYRRGYNGVGVRELASKAGVTIGAFFHYFPTKNHVAHAIIEEIIRTGIQDRWIKPLAAYKNPLQGILKCFKNTFENWPDELVALGCPLNNLTQELSASDETIKAATQAVLTEWIKNTKLHLKRAQEDGYLLKNVDTQELAEFIVTFQEGTFAMGKAMNDRRIFDSMYKNFKRHIDSVSA